MLQVLLGDRVELGTKALLSLQWSCLRLRHLVDFEPTSHGGVHHDFAWSLDFLQTVKSNVIQVAGAVQIPLLVSHHLFKEIVSASFALFPFQKQVVS